MSRGNSVSGAGVSCDTTVECRPPDTEEVRKSEAEREYGSENSYSITERFLEVVASHRSNLAVVTRHEQWTYGELAHRAGRIAALILDRRGAADEPVALLFHHEASMIPGILGVLGAGKFYVPLVADDPPERLRSILKESGCRVILAGPGLEELARRIDSASLILRTVDAPAEPIPLARRSADAISYLLYTSGTTGQPKGVYQCDGNVLHHAGCYASAIGLAPGNRMTLLPAYAFDASVMDVFATLTTGATLCIWNVRGDGLTQLLPWMKRNGVTIWHSTPSLLRVAFPAFDEPADLRWVVLGGEVATGGDLELVLRHGGAGCRLLNGLGPTECTTALQYVADPVRDRGAARLPVGRPVAGTQVVLLDASGNPTDDEGELAIGSRYVALGYWRRPDLTAERFSAAPDDSGRRIYRTGDLIRWTAAGCLEYLGRVDDQIKIRGYRIELSDVQAALSSHGDVVQAVVLARRDVETGETRLVAYLVARNREVGLNMGWLRSHLADRLPDYMIPRAFVPLDALPLLPNGKVDRRALPEPDWRIGDDEYRAPSTPLEGLLAQIWSEVLRRETVGVDDNFFDLGGDSLEAVRILSRIRAQLEVELPPRALFTAPTVSGLARMLTSNVQ
jgi:amino acid adenylation domain-containing protein